MAQLDLDVHDSLTHRCDSWCWLLAGAPGSPCTGAIILQWTEWASLHAGLLTAFQQVRAQDRLRPVLEVAALRSFAQSKSQGQFVFTGRKNRLLMGEATEGFDHFRAATEKDYVWLCR